jgi:hypothetical protein
LAGEGTAKAVAEVLRRAMVAMALTMTEWAYIFVGWFVSGQYMISIYKKSRSLYLEW